MDDALLLDQFESQTLPYREWTHRCHVKVGYLYIQSYGFGEALDRMRRGVLAYNEVNAEHIEVGYHETITRAFLLLIADAVGRAEANDPSASSADAFCDSHPALLDKDVLGRFYSNPRLFSHEAKQGFVEPDLAPLPQPPQSPSI